MIGVGIGLAALVAGMLMGGARGYGLSILAGILAGPYTFIHYLSGTIVAVEPVLRTKPRWLTPFPWLLIVFPLIPVWLTGLAWVVRRAPEPDDDGPDVAGVTGYITNDITHDKAGSASTTRPLGCRFRGSGAASSSARLTSSTRGSATSCNTVASSHP